MTSIRERVAALLLLHLPAFCVSAVAATTAAAVAIPSPRAGVSSTEHAAGNKLMRGVPLYFVPNRGQAGPDTRFVAQGHGLRLELQPDALAITALPRQKDAPPAPVVLQFAGANPDVQLSGAAPGKATINYLIGKDPGKWQRNLPTYRQVRYTNLYPGIDLVCYGADGGRLEYDLIVAPGMDPQQIRFRIGAGHTAVLGPDGALEVDGPHGPLALGRPVFYQNTASGKKMIFGTFIARGNGEFGFRAVHYDRSRPLVIDPPINIVYSTYFGGSLDDEASGMAIDGSGNSYVAGGTNSVDMLSTTNAAQPARGAPTAGYQVTNAFIAKFDPSGTLLYGTYLGGSILEWAAAIAVDTAGNAYVTGLSSSSDFPTTPNAYAAASSAGNQMFIAEISPDGSKLEYSTTYGANSALANGEISSSDHTVVWGNMGIAVSKSGAIYVSASAFAGLPTSVTAYMGSLPQGYLGAAAFAAAFDPTQLGSQQLVAATYLTAPSPSSAQDYSNSRYYGTFSYTLALDDNGNVWIGGQDQTGALPTTANAYQKGVTLGSSCTAGSPMRSAAWLAELSPDLSTLDYASYLSGGTAAPMGGACNEWIQGLASGSDGSIYAAGVTASASFPTTAGVLQASYPNTSNLSIPAMGFVSKFAPAGGSLAWSTYLGQSGGATLIDSAPFVDAQNNVWVGGQVEGPVGSNFPVTANQLTNNNCFQETVSCAFVTGISSDGTSTVFSTTIGASEYPNFTTGVGVDSAGNVHLAGTTNDSNFPLSGNAIQTQLNAGLFAFGGEGDWFFTILGSGAVSTTGQYTGGNDGDVTIALDGTGFQSGATCSLTNGSATISSSQSAVSSDGTQITCTFPLEGATLGNYNIIINEPDGTSVTKQNGFTVEQGQGPNLWVNITGRSHLRANLPSNMTVTYGNSGDTDAVGVVVFVTIPSEVAVKVLTTLLAVPNPQLLDLSTIPQTFTVGSNTVLPLFVPRIGAGSSGSVQIQVTPPASDTNITVSAYNWEPLATSLSDLVTNLGTWQAGNYNQSKQSILTPHLEPTLLTPEWTLPLFGGTPMDKCLQDTIVFGLQISAQIIFDAANPLARDFACGQQLASFIGTAATAMSNSSAADYGPSDAAADLGGLYAGAGQTALACFEAVQGNTPAGMGVNIALGLIAAAIQGAATLKDCSDAVQVQNPQKKNSSVGGAVDPNDKSGPPGDGSASQFIRGQQALTYNLAFENDPTATLPAAQVVITDQLDPTKVTLSTFSLGLISFGSNTINVPYGVTSYTTLYSLSSSLSVKIQANINSSGLITWTFTSIDPSTGLPPTDPTVGFLPPDTDNIVGQGSVLFNVMPINSLATGAQIANTASVVFDSNAAIGTPTWLNTIDVTAPASSVSPLSSTITAAGGQAAIPVSWSGTDVGSGIANYTIYVSVNNAAFSPWLVQTTSTSGAYAGTPGNTYGFYALAIDNAGNVEGAKSASEAVTQVVAPPSVATTTTLVSSSATSDLNVSVTFTTTVAPVSGTGTPTGTVTFYDGATQLGAGTLSAAATATYTTSSLAVGTHSITAQYGGDSVYTASNSSPLTQIVVAPAYTLSANPGNLTIAQGGSGATTITVTPVGGFHQSLSFTCSGLPAYATCVFAPVTLTPDGTNTAVSTTLTIATDVQTVESRAPRLPDSGHRSPLLAFVMFGLGGLLQARRRSRRFGGVRRMAVCALLLGATAFGIVGCGGKGGETGVQTPKGTSTVTVTAAAANATQAVTVNVTID